MVPFLNSSLPPPSFADRKEYLTSWQYPCNPNSHPESRIALNCSGKLSAECIGTNHVILSAIPSLMNSLSSLGTPTYAEKYPEL